MRRAGFVLAGGRSSRMGTDKALLPWEGSALIEHVLRRVASVVPHPVIVGDPQKYGGFGYYCLPDLIPGLGPLGGIHTALESERGDANLIVGCDMPGLNPSILESLFDAARSAHCAAVRDATGQLHPLCAVYTSACRSLVKDRIAERQLRLMDLLTELQPAAVEFPGLLKNCNTPEEWAAQH